MKKKISEGYEGIKMENFFLSDESGVFPFKDRIQAFNHWFNIKSGWAKWSETLPQAEQIYDLLLGAPKTHREWAERFNKVGEINRIIQNEKAP